MSSMPRLRSCPQGVAVKDLEEEMNADRETELNPADYEEVGVLTDKLNKAQSEITRLRSLVLKPKRIEWGKIVGGVMFGTLSGISYYKAQTVFYVYVESNGCWSYKIKPINISATDFHSPESAQAACQAALEAHVMQFTEKAE